MIKKISFLLSLVAVILCTSCGSKMKGLSSEYFTVTPQVLEVIGGKVPVTIDGKFPEKFFAKKAVLTVTPVLKWDGGELAAESMTFQGEKVQGNNRTISYKEGGNFTMKTSYDYVPEMAKSALYLKFTVTKGKKSYTLPEVKVADGCIATSELYRSTITKSNIAIGEDAFQRVIKQAKQANIMFLIQQTNLRNSEKKSEGIAELAASMKDVATDTKSKVLDNVEVAAYASPDGGMSLNTNIAGGREKNTAKFVEQQMKKAELKGNLDTDYTAEDWEGFQELVSKSNLPDKDVILRVLSMYKEPEEREAQIKNISSVYKELAEEILPQLRRARITLNYQLIGRSDEEIQEQFAKDPKQLSLEEILYSSILTENTKEQEKIFTTATNLFPNDYRAYNNLAELAIKAADYATAKDYLNKAARLNASAAEVNTNLGMIALIEGNVADAENYLVKGTDSEANVGALGNLYIAQGQYSRAASVLEDTKSNAAALAQIMAEQYTAAKSTLEAVEAPDAYTYYLKAIVGARTNNAAMVAENLVKAAKLDPSIVERAKKDMEFKKFAAALLNL